MLKFEQDGENITYSHKDYQYMDKRYKKNFRNWV